MAINDERQLGRAKNAVLTYFEGKLIVPKIYLDADWAGKRVDVLAINRDGVGDVHVVLFFPLKFDSEDRMETGDLELSIERLIDRFQTIPAQFKYIAAVDTNLDRRNALFGLPYSMVDRTLSPDGLGRIGFLKVDAPMTSEPIVQIPFKPERFRAKIAKLADEYVQQHEADWEIRA